MCLAVPGKIVSIDCNYALVDFKGNTIRVNIGIVEPNVGDYVLVHAGCAIEVMRESDAQEIIGLLDELEN
jgi:hydrogenase expression/formation protein HypC